MRPERECVSNRQCFWLLFLILCGGTVTHNLTGTAGRDAWLSVLGGALAAAALYAVTLAARKRFPGLDFFAMLRRVFGRFGGGIVTAVLLAAALLSAGVVTANFALFLRVASMPRTPPAFWCLLLLASACFLVSNGLMPAARFAGAAAPVVLVCLVLSTFLSLPQARLSELLPVLGHGALPVVRGALASFAMPFLEGFFLIALLPFGAEEERGYKKPVFLGLLVAAAVLLPVFMRNVIVLRYPVSSFFYYPSYEATGLITAGGFFEREEVITALVFLLCDAIRVAVITLFAARALASFFPRMRYAELWCAAAALGLSLLQLGSSMNAIALLENYQYAAVPLVAAPALIIWLISFRLGARMHEKRQPKA